MPRIVHVTVIIAYAKLIAERLSARGSLVPSRPTRYRYPRGKERLVTIAGIPGPNTSQCLRYVVTVEWRLYGFADYHAILPWQPLLLLSQSYELEIVYIKLA